MGWFCPEKRKEDTQRKARFATSEQKRAIIVSEHDRLRWMALLITGSSQAAERAVVNASELSQSPNAVFQDWLIQWANSATARASVEEVRSEIKMAAEGYAGIICDHGGHDPLSREQVDFLRDVAPGRIIADLDILARATLVLRGVQGASTSDCFRVLEVRREVINAAYCRALRWLKGLQQEWASYDRSLVLSQSADV